MNILAVRSEPAHKIRMSREDLQHRRHPCFSAYHLHLRVPVLVSDDLYHQRPEYG